MNMENVLSNPAALLAMKVALENKEKRIGGVEEKKIVAKVAQGEYTAFVLDASLECNQPSKYGICDIVKIKYGIITTESEKPIEIVASYHKSSSETSLYCRHLSSLLGKDARYGFAFDELIGQACQVTIAHNETERGVYANIAQVTPISFDTLSLQI